MINFSQLINRIKVQAQTNTRGFDQSVRDLAEAYSQAVVNVHNRLQRCEEYLTQGRLCEAIHLAEEPPRLLDVIAQLNFPERDRWHELLSDLGIPVTVAIPSLKAAEELNAAYARYEAQKPLWQQLRRACLERAPLDQRLALLTSLHLLDPFSLAVNEQLKKLQEQRIEEIRSEFTSAYQRQDANAIFGLWREVNSQKWLAQFPGELLASLGQWATYYQQRSAVAQLKQVGTELADAFKRGRLERCRSLAAQFQQIVQDYQVPASEQVYQQFVNLIRWTEDMTQLESLLARGELSQEETARCVLLVRRWRRHLPLSLYREYTRRFAEQKQRERIRDVIWIFFAVTGFIIVLAGVFFWLAATQKQ
ncbi:MAG: hypothetical protein C4297_13570 [Gemmataceae bacterium]